MVNKQYGTSYPVIFCSNGLIPNNVKHTLKPIALALLAFASLAAGATPVSQEQARRVALNFWNLYRDKDVAAQTLPMQQLDLRWDAFYVFAPASGQGFVIVAADDRVQPVLAYSFRNAVMRDSVGRDLAWWLDGYQQQVDDLRASDLKATDRVSAAWQRLTSADGPADPQPLTVVAPLVTTQWDQDAPYNNMCPTRSSYWGTQKAVTGCVATATAQVMRYWSYPVRGTGSHTYYSQNPNGYGQGFGTQTADFGATVYDWDNMPNVVTTTSSNAEKQAVATLMFHCGVLCDMMYGSEYDGGSGAFIHSIPYPYFGNALNGLIQYMGYSSTAYGIDREHYTDSAWTALVKTEIDGLRPIIYAGGDETSGGHCFVCDGYDEQGLYHFNWGWSGAGDGYYTLNNLAPGTGGAGGGTGTYNFSAAQQILVGIRPAYQDDDTLCIIRRFPYTEDFERSATCWTATVSNSSVSYSWMFYDVDGANDYYCAYSAPMTGRYSRYSSTDTLVTPSLVTPGDYRLSWKARTYNASGSTYYSVSVDTLTFNDTLQSSSWLDREMHFTVNEGDTLQVKFIHTANGTTAGVMIDDVTIALADTIPPDDPLAIDNPAEGHSLLSAYPNPTTGLLHVRVDGDELQQVELLDLTGRRLLRSSSPTVDLSALPAGLYLLRCTTSTGVSMQRVVKQ